MSYEIEQGVPITSRYGPRTPVTQALEALLPDQSFVISNDTEYYQVLGKMSKFKPKKFSVRKTGRESWRVWRIE